MKFSSVIVETILKFPLCPTFLRKLFGAEARRDKRFKARYLEDYIVIVSFALPAAPHIVRIGQVVDISKGGLSFRYAALREETRSLSNINIFSYANPEECIENLSCTVIYDNLNPFLLAPNSLRKCAVKFGDLNDDQISGLDQFTHKYFF